MAFPCPAGDRASQEREAHVGASHAVGRDEGRVRGSALAALVQPLHRPASAAAAAADLRPARRLRVFRLRAGDAAHRHPTVSSTGLLVRPGRPELREEDAVTSSSCGWRGGVRLLQWGTPAHHQEPH